MSAPICIVGAGSLGREIVGWMLHDRAGFWSIYGPQDIIFADALVREPVTVCGQVFPVWWPLHLAAMRAEGPAIVAVASPQVRERMTSEITAGGLRPRGFVHSSAVISDHQHLSTDLLALPGAVISVSVKSGRGLILNTHASIGHDCTVGDFCTLDSYATLCGGVTIGDRVRIHTGAKVLPGVRIGDDAVIGAGAVVAADVAAGETVFGVPARRVSIDRSKT